MQRDVYWVDLEEEGRHLHLMVAEDHLNHAHTVLVVPFTSAKFEERRKYHTCVDFDQNSGYDFITRPCVAQAEMILRIERNELHDQAGTISEDDMSRVRDALVCVFGPNLS